jgi:hypothetical protein
VDGGGIATALDCRVKRWWHWAASSRTCLGTCKDIKTIDLMNCCGNYGRRVSIFFVADRLVARRNGSESAVTQGVIGQLPFLNGATAGPTTIIATAY